ncbi:MAG: rhodanese-like domain-containing protein [Gammaproteobacteria bacterium]|nr:rhodanese-like domain-containing protein [Gammaproteobacteria bacterium]MDE0413763.1 rhodanese-like domain-containing protein [Gammaproteobacteria bacterium]
MGRLIEFATAHPWLSLGVVGTLLAALFNEVRLRAMGVSALAPDVAVQAINKGAAIFDLREPQAFGQGHIPNARNIRAVDVPAAPKFKSGKTVLLVCDNGSASGRLAQELRKKGSEQVFCLKGGLAAWQRDNLPVIVGRGRRK